MFHKIKWKELIISIIIALALGFIAAFFTRNSMEIYTKLNLPPLSPSAKVFPIVWSILYFLMGVSAYIIYISKDEMRYGALITYGVQFLFNIIWTLVFFNVQLYFLAFLILLILWILIVVMIAAYLQIDKISAYIQIPYLLWVTFALYLNLGICLLNF